MNKLDLFFAGVVKVTLRIPKTVIFIALLLTAISVYLTSQIKIRSNFSDLLPDRYPSVIQAKELERQVGGASFVVVAVETKDTKNASEFFETLHTRLIQEKVAGIRYIDDRPPTHFLRNHGLLYLSLEDLDKLKETVKRNIEQSMLKKTRLYIDFAEGDSKSDFASYLADLGKKYPTFIQPSNLYQNPSGTLFVSLIKPEWQSTDVNRTQTFVDQLNRVIQEINPDHYTPALSVSLTGPYIKTLTQKKIMIRDATMISTLSFVASILYLFFHFRRKRAVFLIGLPLMMSGTWSLSLAYLFFGSLNLFSSAATAILLGLAADFGIHLYSDYLHHRQSGETPEESLQLSVVQLCRAFLTASATTTTAFIALMFSQFKALYEMGLIAGVGVITCALAFILVLPPLILVIERWKADRMTTVEWSETKTKLSKGWIRWVFSGKNLIVMTFVLLLPLITVASGHLRFDYNLNHILGRQATKDLDRRVDSIFNHSVNPEIVLADNIKDAAKLAAEIRKNSSERQNSKRGTTIKGVVSLLDFVPSRQEKKIKKIHEIRSLFTDLVVKGLNHDNKNHYQQFHGMLSPEKITLSTLPRQIINKFVDRSGHLGRVVFVFPNFEMTEADRFMQFVEEIRSTTCPQCEGPYYASGESSVFYDIVKMLFHDGRFIVGFALISVLIVYFASFRSLSSTLLVFAPLGIGILATLGWMGLMGIQFNIINLAAIPVILGTADDYSIHLYQRYREHPTKSLKEAYQRSFRPILGSIMTTVIGFASLLIANMGGIRSFGSLCVVGILFCSIATLTWFPALLKFADERQKVTLPEDEEVRLA